MTDHAAIGVELQQGDALILVDVQNDFLPGGSLAVPQGDEVVPVLNIWIDAFEREGLPIFATRDWHTADHQSFKPFGGIWPSHCVTETQGAQFAPNLHLPSTAGVVSKAIHADSDAYSGFEKTDLDEQLRNLGVRRLFVGGLATDYCVLNTVLDGLKAGYEVHLIEDAIRAVDVNPGDGERAIAAMIDGGAVPVQRARIA